MTSLLIFVACVVMWLLGKSEQPSPPAKPTRPHIRHDSPYHHCWCQLEDDD